MTDQDAAEAYAKRNTIFEDEYSNDVRAFLAGIQHERTQAAASHAAEVKELVEALERIHHALANAQEWYCSEPEDSELDRDSQVGNWIEKAFDELKELSAKHRARVGDVK